MSVEIIFKEKNPDLFWEFWEKVNKKAGMRYLDSALKEEIEFCSNNLVADKSFVYVVDKEPLAGVFLPIEENDGKASISISNNYVAAPLFLDQSVEKKVFSMIDDIAKENGVQKIMFAIDPLEFASHNFLQKYDYFDSTVVNYVFDLEGTEDLMRACRKGNKCDIKKMIKDEDFKVFYIDKDNPDYEIHEEYRTLHHKCAGRVTRPKGTFDGQFNRLKKGQAVLFGLSYKGKNIAYTYFEFNADKAAYASGSDDPDYDKLPLYHILVFSGLQYLKKIGIKHVDTGQPSCPSQQMDYYPDAKQLNIALFKRGFGGYFTNWFRGVKYFSKDLFEKDMTRCVELYHNS